MCSPTAPPAQARAYYANPPACQSPITGVIRSPHHNTLTFRSPLVIKPRMESCAYTKPESLDSRGRQSYRALTTQCGFDVALLPLAIRALLALSACADTGSCSCSPYCRWQYGLCSPYRLAPIRARARLCAHFVARIHRVFFDCLARSEQQKENRSLCKTVH